LILQIINFVSPQTTEIDRESVLVKRRQNKESPVIFNLEVEAQQADNPLKFTTTKVEITVEDVNDNVPVFTRNEYNVTMREDTHKGKRVLAVKATDKDMVR
jgi:hypothetical protein